MRKHGGSEIFGVFQVLELSLRQLSGLVQGKSAAGPSPAGTHCHLSLASSITASGGSAAAAGASRLTGRPTSSKMSRSERAQLSAAH